MITFYNIPNLMITSAAINTTHQAMSTKRVIINCFAVFNLTKIHKTSEMNR